MPLSVAGKHGDLLGDLLFILGKNDGVKSVPQYGM